MKYLKILFIISLALMFFLPNILKAQDAPGTNQLGIFFDIGFGFANNLRMADRLNARSDGWEAILTDSNQEKPGEPLLYSGISIEPRYFSGNIVYGFSVGYYNIMTGKREVTGNLVGQPTTFKSRLSLECVGFNALIYYKVILDSGNNLLFGGGLGYYYFTMEEEYELRVNGNVVNGLDNTGSDKDKRGALGFQLGIEYNITFGPINISLGFISRFAENWRFSTNQKPNQNSDDNRYSGGITGPYLYAGAGYML